jgi:hypothetical protein
MAGDEAEKKEVKLIWKFQIGAQHAEGNWHAGAIAAAADDVYTAAIMFVEGIIKVSVHYDISYFAQAKLHVRSLASSLNPIAPISSSLLLLENRYTLPPVHFYLHDVVISDSQLVLVVSPILFCKLYFAAIELAMFSERFRFL